MPTLLERFSLWAPVASFMIGIWFFSDPQSVEAAPRVWDKALHASAYTVFGLFCLRAFHGGVGPLRRFPAAGAMLLTLLYGLVDELHQMRIPGRDGSLADWYADALGGGVALASFPVMAFAKRRWLEIRRAKG